MALHAVDYFQTLYIAGHPNDYSETNIFLGSRPSKAEVSHYFALTGALLYGVCKYLPEESQGWVAYPWITIESGAIGNNINLGVKFSF